MNAKKCKALRQYIRQGEKGTTVYQEIKRRAKLVPTGVINFDGEREMKMHVPITIVLGDCDRRAYQHAKKAMRK